MRRPLWPSIVVAAALAAPAFGGPEETLVGRRRTARLEIRHRPGSSAARSAFRRSPS